MDERAVYCGYGCACLTECGDFYEANGLRKPAEKVVSLAAFKEARTQHGQGEAFCLSCDHVWQAVAPTGAGRLECPACRRQTGLWKFEFAPPPGQMVRQCNCGNQLFYLTPEGHLCASCGIYQRYD